MLFFINGPFQFFQVFATLFYRANVDQIVNLIWLKKAFIKTPETFTFLKNLVICTLNDWIYLLTLKKRINILGIRLRVFQKLLVVLANGRVFFIAKDMIY